MEKFKVFIEIEQGSNEKYEYDKLSKELKLDFVFDNLFFPYNYGFIPNTLSGDGEELDAVILSSAPIARGRTVVCKAIGMMEVIDRGEEDNKIICVPVSDPLAEQYHDIGDMSADKQREFKEFLRNIGLQKKKDMEVRAFVNRGLAEKEIKKAITLWK